MPKEGKIRFGYKVFNSEDERLFSLYQAYEYGGINFIEGVISKPRPGCGPITVLKTLKGMKFLYTNCLQESKKCFKVAYKLSKGEVVWNHRKTNLVSSLERANREILLPGATVLAEWVVPLEEVKFK